MALDALLVKCQSGRKDSRKMRAYYDGEKRLEALGVSLPPQMRVLEMISDFPKLAVEVLVEVLNVDGFTMADDTKTPHLLRRWWQRNNLDTVSHLVFREALIQGQAFWIVGNGTLDAPRITGHSHKGIAVRRDHMGDVVEAVRRYKSGGTEFVAHYQPGVTFYYRRELGRWVEHEKPRETGTERVPVVPMTNQVHLEEAEGRSEMLEVIDVADAESRSLTNLQVGQELLAFPQRWLFADGLEQLKDQNGNPIDKLTAYLSNIWTGPEGAKAGQFPGADLSSVINTIKLYAQKVSASTGIPPSMLGISTDNPASAEAMRAAKERLITKGESKQNLFGDSLEDAMKIALEMYQPSHEVRGIETLETNWRDIATPSKSSQSANMLQAHSQGVISAHTARDHLNLTPEQRAFEDARDTGAEQLARSVGL